MAYSKEELETKLLEALKILKEASTDNVSDRVVNEYSSYFYTPDKRLPGFLAKLKYEIEKRNNRHPDALSNSEIGKLMEQIAFLCFQGLTGYSDIKSFQSAGPQYDLIVSGESHSWAYLCEFLYLGENSDFLVEVKAEKRRIGDPQFARLCSLLTHNLHKTCRLGIFFTLKGATGFPDRKSKARNRSLSNSRLRQVIFMASCKKPIVVFDEYDIYQLSKNGSLIHILREKIRDVEHLSGVPINPQIETPKKCDLPSHLLELS